MRAIRLHEFGPPSNLVLDDLPDLTAGPGQVRIRVEASGVHLLDTALRRGEPGGPMPLPALPTVPGREVAGTVDAVGAGVAEAWRGRRVVAHLGMVPGGYAEQAVTSVDTLFEVPERLSMAEAVAAVGTGRTALGIVETEPPTATDVVFVPSAAGGLGWLLAQAARHAGATVVLAARGERRTARLAELGADLVVDYGRADWIDRVRSWTDGFTLVYDGIGGTVGREALELLRPGGRFVMFGYSAGTPTRFDVDDVVSRSLTVGWLLGERIRSRPGGIAGLAGRSVRLAGRGWWRPLVSTYPLADAATAHADLEGRRALGKVVLTPAR
ncbi:MULTISPECIES: zinc-binding dehydrogenase [Micromonospora]|uniref:NADPH2:quinone reductase n=1 Tax=Micromonospora yangpuensis TaxID=683228 RepID=A0A1C6U4P4_9ACTN|nr:zinc-binding dehydrogenase [Micromonospora yangpuensis]GGL92554.1 oxidoreductase [Micromonospora yangpuensis]SCL48964.1 NADPH2:quinone reductase [Micromonospora yangpuensis]